MPSKEKPGFFMDMNISSLQFTNQTISHNNVFKIYHQNIRSLRKKLHELIGHLHPISPHVICLNEHHLDILEKTYVNIEGYTIGAQFCRVPYGKGGAIIYVHNSLQYTNIDLSKYCKENYIEICAVKLIINSLNILIITIYRTPSGNFNYFLQQLDNILQSFSTSTSHIIICGDLNINYLIENPQKRQLDNLLLLYNLKSIVNFPTRTSNSSASALFR
jgi:exonuclease III